VGQERCQEGQQREQRKSEPSSGRHDRRWTASTTSKIDVGIQTSIVKNE
jgi:hypothetical protein